jgi:hypothetical protein
MKKLLFIFLAITLNACDKNDSPRCVGIDCLPPATQTGAGTFGCLVNGVPFYTNVGITCFYQLVGGEYYFAIGVPRESGFPDTVALGTDSLQIEDDQSYQLGEPLPGNAFAEVLFRFDQTIPGFI